MAEGSSLFEAALDRLLGDMDDTEGRAATSHSVEECPDPLGCTAHDSDSMGDLAQSGKPAIEIEVHKAMAPGEPSLDDKGEADEGLSEEDKNILKKILG